MTRKQCGYLALESDCAGTNSSLSFRPIPAARRLSVRSDGFAVPLSSLLIFVWWIPVACASWFCVRWFSSRPSMMARTTVPPAPGYPTAPQTPDPVSFSASRRSDLASCQGAPFIVSLLLRVPPVLPAARQMPGTGFRHTRKQSPASHARPAASLPPPPE